MNNKTNKIKVVPNSEDAYAKLKPITDAAQSEKLRPWSPSVVNLLAGYGVDVQRLEDHKVQANLSFPTSIKDHRSMAIGFRYAKKNGGFAEDLFVFVEDVGLTCYYRGAQEKALPEYDGSHHEKIDIKLSEFFPDLQRDIADMKQQISELKNTSGVELITDEMHRQAMQDVQNEFNEKVRSFANAHGNSSAVQQYSRAVQIEASKKRRELQSKKALSDKVYSTGPTPEIALNIRAQANTNRFEVQLVNNSGQSLVAEEIKVNDISTPLNQQFNKLFPIPTVNIPDGIFDNKLDEVIVTVSYRTLDGKSYELSQKGTQQHRNGDGRYNVIFNTPASIGPVGS